jgi:hypothetical protein
MERESDKIEQHGNGIFVVGNEGKCGKTNRHLIRRPGMMTSFEPKMHECGADKVFFSNGYLSIKSDLLAEMLKFIQLFRSVTI